jgi:NAD(P)-dependent dehydrogenase (short-subunit alcohol dehydrogenase family)
MLHYDFSGKTALIVGASSGIGEATVRAFGEAGANVVAGGLGPLSSEYDAWIAAHDSRVRYVPTDVRSSADVQRLVSRAVTDFGAIDFAVNNAGIEGPFGPVEDATEEEFDQVIGVNLKGVWLGMKHQIPRMRAQGRGVIVNTSSTAGVKSIQQVGIYSASKHGIVGLSKAAALELASTGIRVNVIAPGPVATGLLSRMVAGQIPLETIASMVPLQRISAPAEIAAAILWLCSDAASFVTGQTLLVDGGLTIA